MTEENIIRKAERYRGLMRELEREMTKREPSEAIVASLERSLARIELEFQQADLDINQFVED